MTYIRRAGVVLAFACMGVCSAQAASTREVLYKLTGRIPSGSFSYFDFMTRTLSSGSFGTTLLSNGTEGVFVQWQSCVFAGGSPVCTDNSAGIAPAGAVRMRGSDTIELDFDSTKLLVTFFSAGPSTWKGKLTRYTGLYSSSMTSTGQMEVVSKEPSWLDPNAVWTNVQRTTGKRVEATAVFTGSIGAVSIQAPPSGSNGSMVTHNGGEVVLRYTTY